MENTNKIEVLRALCYDEKDMTLIKNPPYSFSQSEIDCVVEFKKMFEQGLGSNGKTGVKRFINRLISEAYKGSIDSYTINYFVKELLNGPFKEYVRKYTKGKPFFKNSPDIMGCLGDVVRTPTNVSICPSSDFPLGTFPTIYSKIPSFMRSSLQKSSKTTEELFRSNMRASWGMDNTLPLVDKNPGARTSGEPSGGYDRGPIGNFCIKDVTDFYDVKVGFGQLMPANVKKALKENTDYQKLYLYKKYLNNFDNNNSTSENHKIEKMVIEGEKAEVVVQDLFGEEFDTDEKRAAKLKLETEESSKEYVLNTNEGQLGN